MNILTSPSVSEKLTKDSSPLIEPEKNKPSLYTNF
mgnify:CR=1 FL=1